MTRWVLYAHWRIGLPACLSCTAGQKKAQQQQNSDYWNQPECDRVQHRKRRFSRPDQQRQLLEALAPVQVSEVRAGMNCGVLNPAQVTLSLIPAATVDLGQVVAPVQQGNLSETAPHQTSSAPEIQALQRLGHWL